MKKKKRRYPEWVTCINCYHEYEKEELDGFEGCQICGSKEYESSEKNEFKLNNSWDDWR